MAKEINTLMASLPFADLGKLPLQDNGKWKECPVCGEDYTVTHLPIVLPCDHIMGQNCLRTRLQNQQVNCIFCQTRLLGQSKRKPFFHLELGKLPRIRKLTTAEVEAFAAQAFHFEPLDAAMHE